MNETMALELAKHQLYPSISQYIESVKDAEDNFATLTHLRPVIGEDGNPVMTSGNFAVVFKMKDNQTGKFYAVKCFIKDQKDRDKNYRLIADELEYITPTTSYLTNFQYLEKELFVDTNDDNNEFPVLLMDWVDGITLDKYIREHINDKYSLGMLAYRFSLLVTWLIPQPFAHGDIKPDNILVTDDGNLVLVDYDGMYVPAMKGQKARELGSPDFHHPSRTVDDFDEHIDDFSLVSILLSIRLIAYDSTLLERYGASDRLLFSEDDYRDIRDCKLLRDVFPSSNKNVNVFVGLFTIALSEGYSINNSFLLFELQCLLKDDNTLLAKAMRGDAQAQNRIGENYYNGKEVAQDFTEAVKWYRKSAEQGYFVAQNHLGYCYFNGKGADKDYDKAVKWFLKSAKQGYCKAQCNMGNCYESGRGVSQDYSEAAKWYLKAAEQGNAVAQKNLGYCYDKGIGVTQNYEKAVEWYRKAAEQGNDVAQNNLGVCYKKGKGVTQDFVKAVEWYRKAAEQGNDVAQNNLGFCYYNGRGVTQDYAEAVKLYRKSANQGNANAQYNLGNCYMSGNGAIQNKTFAVKWYKEAAKNGNTNAKARLISLGELK